jgi:hypothetical protein
VYKNTKTSPTSCLSKSLLPTTLHRFRSQQSRCNINWIKEIGYVLRWDARVAQYSAYTASNPFWYLCTSQPSLTLFGQPSMQNFLFEAHLTSRCCYVGSIHSGKAKVDINLNLQQNCVPACEVSP